MKWLIVTLVLANLAMFSWHRGQTRFANEGAVSPGPDADIPGLILVTELTPEEVRFTEDDVSGLEGDDSYEQGSQSVIALDANAFEDTTAKNIVSDSIVDQQCWMLGPVVDEAIIQRLSRELVIFELGVTTRQPDGRAQAGFMVYIPTFDSDEARRDRRKALSSKGVANFVVHDGEFKNGIALGLFDSKANAQDWRNRLKMMGFDSEIGASSGIALKFWVTASAQVYESLSGEFLGEISRLNPGLDVSVVACRS